MSIDVRKFAADAMDEAVAAYSVGIPAVNATGPVIGSGVAIEFNGKRFILTAAHHAMDIEPATVELFGFFAVSCG